MKNFQVGHFRQIGRFANLAKYGVSGHEGTIIMTRTNNQTNVKLLDIRGNHKTTCDADTEPVPSYAAVVDVPTTFPGHGVRTFQLTRNVHLPHSHCSVTFSVHNYSNRHSYMANHCFSRRLHHLPNCRGDRLIPPLLPHFRSYSSLLSLTPLQFSVHCLMIQSFVKRIYISLCVLPSFLIFFALFSFPLLVLLRIFPPLLVAAVKFLVFFQQPTETLKTILSLNSC